MENRSLNRLGKIGTVDSTARFAGIGRETNLVVYDDMDSTTDFVIGQVSHLHTFIDHSLSSEGGISVDYDGNYLFTINVTHQVLLGASTAKDNWVNCLQMRGVS